MRSNKILAFLLALVISVVLWFYAVTVVNPDDTVTISGIPVQFEGTEALQANGLMLTGGESAKVSIKVSGRRSDLKELNNENVTAVADVTRIAAKGEYQLTWSVVWPSAVATGDISEVSRTPSRISVEVSEIKENPALPVELEYIGEPTEGFMVDKSSVTVNPEALTLRGPAEEVNQVARAVVQVDVTDANAVLDGEYSYVLLDQQGQELTLSKYTTVSAEQVRVTVPVLRYKDLSLKVELTPGGGATEANVDCTIEPPTVRVTGSEAALENLSDTLVLRTIDLAQVTADFEEEITPELPQGVTLRAGSERVKLSLKLVNLVTREYTIPAASIVCKNGEAGMVLGEQSVKITVRGARQAVNLNVEDIRVSADLTADYDAAAKTVTLTIELPAGSTAGVIGGPYVAQVVIEDLEES